MVRNVAFLWSAVDSLQILLLNLLIDQPLERAVVGKIFANDVPRWRPLKEGEGQRPVKTVSLDADDMHNLCVVCESSENTPKAPIYALG